MLGTYVLTAMNRSTSKSIPLTVLQAACTLNIVGLDAFDRFGLQIEDNVLKIVTPPPPRDIDKLCSDFHTLWIVMLRDNFAANVTLRPDAHPKFCRARLVPHTLCEKVANGLRHLEE